MNELILPVVNQKVGLLEWNFEQINTALDTYLEKYQNLIVTQDDIKEAKDIKQELGRVKNMIEERRKAAKAEYCKPYDIFAEQVKVVTGKIDSVTGNIDDQLKTFDQKEKNIKKEVIRQYWEDECPTSPAVPFEKVFEPKMLNKTCTEKQWKAVLNEKAERIRDALTTIAEFEDTQKRDYVLTSFMDNLNLGTALSSWQMYTDQLRRAEEFRQKAAQRAQATMEKMNLAKPADEPQNRPIPAQKEPAPANPQPQATGANEPVLHRCMEVWGTRQQIIDLGNYMNANGIKFRKVELKDGEGK